MATTKTKVVNVRKREYSCTNCKSCHTVRHGYNVTKTGRYARRKCQECGTTFYEKDSVEC